MADKRLIPDGIRDVSTEALNELIDRLGTLDLTPLLIYIIDQVNSSALPHLAEQFHVTGLEGWELARTDAEKRGLIKRAIELHRYKGTVRAIKDVLRVLGLEGVIREWFQYGGQPYHFKIEIATDNRELTADLRDKLIDLVTAYKNVRSRLEEVLLIYMAKGEVRTQTGCMGEVGSYAGQICKYEWQTVGDMRVHAGCMGEVTACLEGGKTWQ